jgi:catechol 2,3-dioxygenase-like lactoylglutathione lyase family enzyme
MEIVAYEHVGIRVSDRDQAVAFYEQLGFKLERDLPEYRALILATPGGVKVNLIYNATPRSGASNILMDEGVKHPGVTHPAFVVTSLDATLESLAERGIPVTGGPPDGNVVEFDEYV